MSFDTYRQSKCLVTGGAGFIGSHIVDKLVSLGAEVTVLDNLSSGSMQNIAHHGDSIRFIEGDIRDFETCLGACEGQTYIFHQAAMGSVPRSVDTPHDTISNNVMGTCNIFTAARDKKVNRVVYASSSSVYGDSEALPKREGEEGAALSPYATSKWMNEELAAVFSRCYEEISFVGLRYFNIYGPRQSANGPYAAVIPKFYEAALSGKAMTVFGDGEQSRDFTYVADAVAANLLSGLADESATNHAYNIGAEGNTTVNDLANTIASLTDHKVPTEYLAPRAGDVRASNASIERAKTALKYAPSTQLEEGLRNTLTFWREAFGSK